VPLSEPAAPRRRDGPRPGCSSAAPCRTQHTRVGRCRMAAHTCNIPLEGAFQAHATKNLAGAAVSARSAAPPHGFKTGACRLRSARHPQDRKKCGQICVSRSRRHPWRPRSVCPPACIRQSVSVALHPQRSSHIWRLPRHALPDCWSSPWVRAQTRGVAEADNELLAGRHVCGSSIQWPVIDTM